MPTNLRSAAEQARQAGDYSLTTLRLFIQLRHHAPTPLNTVRHALFCRDLGYPLSPVRARRLQLLTAMKPWRLYICGMKPRHVRQLQNLLAEYSDATNAEHSAATNISDLSDEIGRTQAYNLSNNQSKPAVAKPYQARVATWRAQQREWSRAFERDVHNANRIAVVGNSPSIAGQHLGTEIDVHDMVIRFNHYHSEHTNPVDTGTKLSLWCMAPGVDKAAPSTAPAVVIAGPNMLYQQQSFPQLQDYQGPVLAIPLHIWRELVSALQAPPSAGVLLIAYLEYLLGSGVGASETAIPTSAVRQSIRNEKISIYGFADIVGPNHPCVSLGEQYHHSLPQHRPVTRHNWQREREWLSRFIGK